MQAPPPPFSYTYSPNVPEILTGLGCSLAISTYQTGKVVLFSAKDKDTLIQLPRNFQRPMGMALHQNTLALALKSEVMLLSDSPALAKNYPQSPDTYDALYVPRSTFYTGTLDIHDLAWTNKGLVAVNTAFSCLAALSHVHSFEPIWQPPFITDLSPEDRCHLNGIAVDNGTIKYASALGNGNTALSWKEQMITSGILMDIESNELILKDLPVPHSPRSYADGLFMLLSGTGQLVKVDPEKGTYDEVTKINGFLRGMDRIGDYLFVAMSKLRQSSSIFKDAPVARNANHCGVSIIYLPTGNQVGYILYHTTVDELFEVKILPGTRRPNIMNLEKGVHLSSVTTREKVFWHQPVEEEEKEPINESLE